MSFLEEVWHNLHVGRFLGELWHNLRFADIADIFVVSILLYFGLQWLRKRAARAVAAALCLLALVYVGARVLNMYLTLEVFRAGLTVLVVSLVIIFQQDIRRTFEQLSAWRGFHGNRSAENWSALVGNLIETTASLAKQKIGALIVLEGRQPLDPYIEGGVVIKGRISTSLLVSIFHPATPGHDGAVVIDRDRIEMLGAYLPLSHNLDQIGKGGTRHAAALGLAEVCDALIIVVSEERGTVSVAEQGELTPLDSLAGLKNRLESFYKGKYPTSRDNSLSRSWRRNLPLKVLSLGLASLLWFFVAYRVEPIQRIYEDVPIDLRQPKHFTVDDPKPSKTRVTLVGPERAFDELDRKNLKISIDLQKYPVGQHEIELDEKYLNLPAGLHVRHFDNGVVKVNIYRLLPLSLPVKWKKQGTLSKDLELEKEEVTPASANLTLRDFGQTPPTEVETTPVPLGAIKQPGQVSFTALLVLPPHASLSAGQGLEVRVTLTATKK
jgi:uncharacterized protein (TIGR00159 family)